jgi:hypothetical protein
MSEERPKNKATADPPLFPVAQAPQTDAGDPTPWLRGREAGACIIRPPKSDPD